MTVSRPVQRGCCCLLICSLIYLVVTWTSSSGFRPVRLADEMPVRPPRKPVLIYAATKFFKMDVTSERFLSKCTSSKDWCSISEDVRDLPRADAVLFHNADFDVDSYRGVDNKNRKANIPYVLWSLESPANDIFRPKNGKLLIFLSLFSNGVDLSSAATSSERVTSRVSCDFINWTMTYRRDADIWYPYGRMERRKERIDVDFEKIWSNKKQSLPPATWLASNCYAANGRTIIVARLEDQGLKVDKWGKCGRPPPACAGVELQEDKCVVDLIKPYKFYLAFENSNCIDYVTEKFYETLRSRQAVPVVLHRKLYEDLGIPSSSFIALSDYPTTVDAVKEIMRIAEDKNAYLEYHKWREEYEIIPEHNDGTGFCSLCRKLAERAQLSPKERIVSRKYYRSVQDWHSNDMCNNTFTFN